MTKKELRKTEDYFYDHALVIKLLYLFVTIVLDAIIYFFTKKIEYMIPVTIVLLFISRQVQSGYKYKAAVLARLRRIEENTTNMQVTNEEVVESIEEI